MSNWKAYKILFVDDEANKIQAIVRPLEKRGFSIAFAHSPDEARALLKKDSFSVIVSDQRMPDETGVDFLAQLAHTHPNIVRILFTGFTDHETAVKAINTSNIFRYILKTQSIDSIAGILEEAVKHYADHKKKEHLASQAETRGKAKAALNVLRDVKYDWGNVVLNQKIGFDQLRDLLHLAEKRFDLDLSELKAKCEKANTEADSSLKEYFHNPFLDSTLVEEEAVVEDTLLIPIQLALRSVEQRTPPEKIVFSFNAQAHVNYIAHHQRKRLKAAVGLLLLNAVESIESEGTVSVSLDRSEADGKPCFRIAVSDTGKGIAPDAATHIFEPLFKTPDKQGHMGIGLTFVKTIAEDHGGSAHFASTPGKGSTFTILLPA